MLDDDGLRPHPARIVDDPSCGGQERISYYTRIVSRRPPLILRYPAPNREPFRRKFRHIGRLIGNALRGLIAALGRAKTRRLHRELMLKGVRYDQLTRGHPFEPRCGPPDTGPN